MNTFWMITFLFSMLSGAIFAILFVVGLFRKNLKIRPKKSAIIVGISFVLFIVSSIGYDATMSEEQRIEVEKRQEQEAEEKAEQEAKEKVEQEAKEKAEQEAKEKAEQIVKEKAEQEAKEKAEQEAKEKAEQIAKEKVEQEVKEKDEQEIDEEETTIKVGQQDNTKGKVVELEGRGRSDVGRNEPQYENVLGYVVTSSSEDYTIEKTDDFVETPWIVPTYEKDKQFYVESGYAEHKTEVIVHSQELEHEGYGAYSGYLLVERIDDGVQFYINVSNFITKEYWEYEDLIEAALVGNYIAEYSQISDYYPVDKSNEKVELDDGMKVLVVGKTGTYGRRGPDNETNSIEAIVFKEWKYGYGGVNIFFNEEDLSIVY